MAHSYTVNPIAVQLAQCLYYANAQFAGQPSVMFDQLPADERVRFIGLAVRVLLELNPPPRARRIDKVPATAPKPIRFEVWELDRTLAKSRFIDETARIELALAQLTSRRPLRVRTFYDRHRKRRIVQFLCGNGLAVDDAR